MKRLFSIVIVFILGMTLFAGAESPPTSDDSNFIITKTIQMENQIGEQRFITHEFDLEKAKSGARLCSRDKCFEMKIISYEADKMHEGFKEVPIIVAVFKSLDPMKEAIAPAFQQLSPSGAMLAYGVNGKMDPGDKNEDQSDLMILEEIPVTSV